jgi:hypothetical protein
MAQVGGRRGRPRRTAVRSLDRQGRFRGAVPRRRDVGRDQGARRRDRGRGHRAGRRECRRRGCNHRLQRGGATTRSRPRVASCRGASARRATSRSGGARAGTAARAASGGEQYRRRRRQVGGPDLVAGGPTLDRRQRDRPGGDHRDRSRRSDHARRRARLHRQPARRWCPGVGPVGNGCCCAGAVGRGRAVPEPGALGRLGTDTPGRDGRDHPLHQHPPPHRGAHGPLQGHECPHLGCARGGLRAGGAGPSGPRRAVPGRGGLRPHVPALRRPGHRRSAARVATTRSSSTISSTWVWRSTSTTTA